MTRTWRAVFMHAISAIDRRPAREDASRSQRQFVHITRRAHFRVRTRSTPVSDTIAQYNKSIIVPWSRSSAAGWVLWLTDRTAEREQKEGRGDGASLRSAGQRVALVCRFFGNPGSRNLLVQSGLCHPAPQRISDDPFRISAAGDPLAEAVRERTGRYSEAPGVPSGLLCGLARGRRGRVRALHGAALADGQGITIFGMGACGPGQRVVYPSTNSPARAQSPEDVASARCAGPAPAAAGRMVLSPGVCRACRFARPNTRAWTC